MANRRQRSARESAEESSGHGLRTGRKELRGKMQGIGLGDSVADPGCLSRIPDPIFSIPDPGSELSPSGIPDPHQRI